jgi:uncharacterized phage protein (TIGR01671 family)
MNREIKFRTWHFGHKRMFTGNELVSIDFKSNHVLLYDQYGWTTIGTLELMQFTGLHDKNGKEIYERDILSDRWMVEVYRNDEGTFMVKFGTNPKINRPISLKQYLLKREKAGTSVCEGYRDCIVIGNSYKNPELIKPA